MLTLIDEHGRLFGKVNLIDAIVGLGGTFLVLIGYSAYILFRTPPPLIIEVKPAKTVEGEPTQVTVIGDHLRPFLVATVGGRDAEFLLGSPTSAVLMVPDLPAGTYDVTLYDVASEVARRPGALTVVPRPRLEITAVEPATVVEGEKSRVTVRGTNFRPFLRATVGMHEATFLIESPHRALLELPALSAGTYDVVLYDQTQELARERDGVTVEPPAFDESVTVKPPAFDAEVTVTGSFLPLNEAAAVALAAKLNAHAHEPAAWGTILGAEPPYRAGRNSRATATLKLRCTIVDRECTFGDTRIRPTEALEIPLFDGRLTFVVDEVLSPESTPLEILLRVEARPEVMAVVRRMLNDTPALLPLAERRVSIVSLEVVEELSGDATLAERRTGLVTVAMIWLRVPAAESSTGWSHLGQPLKVGANYTFETNSYVLGGQILDLRVGSHPTRAMQR